MFRIDREIPWGDLEPAIRATMMLGQPDVFPYAHSDIRIEKIPSHRFEDDPQDPEQAPHVPIRATTKYVLAGRLVLQDRLRQDLVTQLGPDRDQLALIGGLVVRDTETDQQVVVIPPLVEESDQDGSYLLDGAHRFWSDRTRRQQGVQTGSSAELLSVQAAHPNRQHVVVPVARLIHAVVVRDPAYPSYAIPNSWREVKVVDAVPANPADKKNYRNDHPGGYRALYRDLSHLGSAGLRAAG